MRTLALTILAATILSPWQSCLAQNAFIDTVTITAPDPNASEAGPDSGLFEIRRTGPTNFGLAVFFRVGGTASNGVDYQTIPAFVVIPAGSLTTSIPVQPIDDKLVEGTETVVLQIVPSLLLCPSPACGYFIGWPSNATVTIADNDSNPSSNQPPLVQLNSPQDMQHFVAPAEVELRAYAQDPEDAFNVTVEFFEGANSLGIGTFVPTKCASPYCPYFALTWSNVPAGSYVLTAKATDTGGASSISDPEHISVFESSPGVNIYATDRFATEPGPRPDVPADTATFTVRRSDGTNGSIAVFYSISGTASNGVDYEPLSGQVSIPEGAWSADIAVTPIFDDLVEGTETVVLTLLAPCPACLFANPPCEVAQGTNCYQIGPDNQAVAYIRDASTNQLPPTNLPIVTIIASDPIAVEGQFCWSNWWWTISGSLDGWRTNSWDWRTNHCSGSNTATFVVRRSGETNSALTVFYAVGGTASNGVDYIALPGQVTIPAGHRAARIEVIPIDDAIPERIETVLLSLQSTPAPAGSPPDYQIGFPRRAAAIILDNDQPRPRCGRLVDGMFHFCEPGTNGYSFYLRASTDLVNWFPLCTNVVTEGAIHFVDPDASGIGSRFYRATPEPNYSPPQ